MDSELIDHPEHSRFELSLPGGAVAFLDYRRRSDGVLLLTHAEVPETQRGGGIGARLTGSVLALLRERDQRMVPVCPYVIAYLQRHPEYLDVLDPAVKR